MTVIITMIMRIVVISIYKLGDVVISSNLIGSLSLANGHCPPPGRWTTSCECKIMQFLTIQRKLRKQE